jgi:pseudoazurin
MCLKSLIASALLTALVAAPASANEVEVKMLNKGTAGPMVFEPALVRVSPGDKVTFVATDKTHNAETIQGMLPAGAQAFAGKMSENLSVTFDKEGVYGIKCQPHYGMGMIALVIVGSDSANLAEAKSVKHPGRAKERFEELFAE